MVNGAALSYSFGSFDITELGEDRVSFGQGRSHFICVSI